MNILPKTQLEYGSVEQPVMCLAANQIKSFPVKRRKKKFHLIEGRAWITYDNNDVIVESGETIAIPASRHRVIISASNPNHSICYQLS